MRELLCCNEHGVRWVKGDAPCPKCAERVVKSNSSLRIYTTKKGRTWPEDVHSRNQGA